MNRAAGRVGKSVVAMATSGLRTETFVKRTWREWDDTVGGQSGRTEWRGENVWSVREPMSWRPRC